MMTKEVVLAIISDLKCRGSQVSMVKPSNKILKSKQVKIKASLALLSVVKLVLMEAAMLEKPFKMTNLTKRYSMIKTMT